MGPFSNDVAKDKWDDVKPTTPNGQLPICTLEDGSVIPESGAIMRACAAQTGLLGKGKDFVISEMLVGMTGDLVKETFGRYTPRPQSPFFPSSTCSWSAAIKCPTLVHAHLRTRTSSRRRTGATS